MKDATATTAGTVHVLYEIDGHLYTTFIVAVLAGHAVPRALEISWGSQLPDAKKKFTAVNAAWTALWSERASSIMKTLHSLHGGNQEYVTKRRADLKDLVSAGISDRVPSWRVGLMIHAFADSYAHTRLEDGKEEAYGGPLGHALDGHTPDEIGKFPDKYLTYVSELYSALGGSGDPFLALAPLYKIVQSNAGNSAAITSKIISCAGQLGWSAAESDVVRDRLLRDITMDDVVSTMEAMEAYFARPPSV